jgi:hypothetical protein
MQVLGQVRAFAWSGDESTGGEDEQEMKTREGHAVEKEQEEKAKKEQRTDSRRGRRRRSRQEAREQQGAAA